MTTEKKKKPECRKAHLDRQEFNIYELLREFMGNKTPMKLVWYILNSTLNPDESFNLPSLTGDLRYNVDVEGNVCRSDDEMLCKGFAAHGDCSHLKAMRIRTRIMYARTETHHEPVKEDHAALDEFDGVLF